MPGWTSPEGLQSLKSILQNLIPQWPAGPYDWQLQATARILDRKHQVVIAACGDGKTAVAYLHVLVMKALAADATLPRFGVKVVENPVALMTTPLTDLGHSQVAEMTRMGVKATALDRKSVQDATNKGRNLFREVEDSQWSVIIASPERLTTPQFDKILRNPHFLEDVVLNAIDEGHVVEPWSRDYRESYADINRLRARLPSHVPVLTMSATLRPDAEVKLMKHLGLPGGTYERIQRSCERPNLRVACQTLKCGLNGDSFPDLIWAAEGKVKVIIYCQTVELGYRVVSFLQRLRPVDSGRRKRNIRPYNALTEAENANTLDAFRNDPETFVIVATIKFGMGVDLRHVDISVNLGMPDSVEAIVQQNGRAGRDPHHTACGITYIEPAFVAAVAKDADLASFENPPAETLSRQGRVLGDVDLWRASKSKRQPPKGKAPTEIVAGSGSNGLSNRTATAKQDTYLRRIALCHAGSFCLVAEYNRIFGGRGSGAGSGSERASCITAGRRLHCSSCIVHLPPPLQPPGLIPTVRGIPSTSRPMATSGAATDGSNERPLSHDAIEPAEDSQANSGPVTSHPRLTKDMQLEAKATLECFSQRAWASKDGSRYRHLPYSLYLSPYLSTLLTNLHMIRDREALAGFLFNWEYLEEDGHALFDTIRQLNCKFDTERTSRKKGGTNTKTRGTAGKFVATSF